MVINNIVFEPFVDNINSGTGISYYLYMIVENFFVIAFSEEGFKWLALMLVAKNTKHFNSLFDGIIYAVFVSLGFAAFENVLYTFNYGMETALVRAVTAVPGHMFDAVIMGYYFSWYHIRSLAGKYEIKLKDVEVIPLDTKVTSGNKDLILSLLMPVLAHGFYDFCCTVEGFFSTVGFAVFLAFLYVFCFRRIGKMSDEDTSDAKIALAIIAKKHPVILDGIRALSEVMRYKAQTEGIPMKKITFDELCDFMGYCKKVRNEVEKRLHAHQTVINETEGEG